MNNTKDVQVLELEEIRAKQDEIEELQEDLIDLQFDAAGKVINWVVENHQFAHAFCLLENDGRFASITKGCDIGFQMMLRAFLEEYPDYIELIEDVLNSIKENSKEIE